MFPRLRICFFCFLVTLYSSHAIANDADKARVSAINSQMDRLIHKLAKGVGPSLALKISSEVEKLHDERVGLGWEHDLTAYQKDKLQTKSDPLFYDKYYEAATKKTPATKKAKNGYQQYYKPTPIGTSKELLEVAVNTLALAEDDIPQLEKGLFFAKAASSAAIGESIRNNLIQYPDSLKFGVIAKKLAETYANPNSEHYNLDKSLTMHRRAGFYGIQSSFMAAGYIHRFKDKTALLKDYSMASLISGEMLYFRRASDCSDENTTRKHMPYSTDICEVAYLELQDAKERYNDANHTPSGQDAAIWIAVGLLGLAVLAESNGASVDASTSNEYNGLKNTMDAINRAELEFAFVQ